jgi:phospholipase/carboxylesterase
MTPTRLREPQRRPAEGFYRSTLEGPCDLPLLTFLPTDYQPRYEYPLLVFFHQEGANEKQMMRLVPSVSRRNYICLGLRGPERVFRPSTGNFGCGWEGDEATESLIEEYVFEAIAQTCEMLPIHSDRIFLAGLCEGATPAYRLAFRFPEKFAGVMAFNGHLPQGGLLWRLSALRRLQVFMGHGIANVAVPLATAQRDHKLLYTAGLNVQLHTYATTHRLHPDMFRDLNRWTMQVVTGCPS